MMTSAPLHLGPGHVSLVESELRSWLADHEYVSVSELRGSVSQATSIEASAFERANYLKILHSWTSDSIVLVARGLRAEWPNRSRGTQTAPCRRASGS